MIVLTDCCKSTGQPRRHLLQSGWCVFVTSKRLVPEDAFIFLRSVVSSLLFPTQHFTRFVAKCCLLNAERVVSFVLVLGGL
jgi:hypothetical protein